MLFIKDSDADKGGPDPQHCLQYYSSIICAVRKPTTIQQVDYLCCSKTYDYATG